MTRTRHSTNRAFVLIAVMAIVGSALFISTGLLFTTTVETAGAIAEARRAQSMALAWSGLQAVMARLDDQKQHILDGDSPTLEAQYTIYEAGANLGVVRLQPLGSSGQRLVGEAGRLDVNTVDAETLVRTGLIDEPLAEAIMQFRDSDLGRPFQSLDELLMVPGITAAKLHGSGESQKVAGGQMPVASTDNWQLASGNSPGLADMLTVYAWEPAVQRDGSPRICLNVLWSDDLARRIDARFGSGESDLLKHVFESGVKFDRESRLFEVMRAYKVEPKSWPDILDVFTTEEGPMHFGRVDLNTAPVEALVALPGMRADQAARIVAARQSLSTQDRASIAWPTLQGIVPAESYDALAGRITTRCFTWRFKILAGEVASSEPEGELRHPVAYEAVVDLSGPTPRLAYLRDVTLLDTVAQLAARGDEAGEKSAELTPTPPPVEAAAVPDDSLTMGGSADGSVETGKSISHSASEASARPSASQSGVAGKADDDADAGESSQQPPSSRGIRSGRWRGGG